MADGVHRDIAELGAGFVEIVDHADRVLDQRRVALHPVTAEDRQTRIVERRGEDRAGLLDAVLLDGFIRIGADIEPLELLDPVFEAVGTVNRVVVFVFAFLQHQPLDVILSLLGRLQRDVRGRRRSRALAAQIEPKERLFGIIDRRCGTVSVGVLRVEIDVERRVGLRLAGGNRLFVDVVVAASSNVFPIHR